MFQTNNKQYSEADFAIIVDAFNKGILKHEIELESNPEEFDMKVKYAPNWACIWNRPSNIGKSCSIIMKNDRLAMVQFGDDEIVSNENVLSHLYRLEDLTKLS